jgi:hypothetical protein
LNSCVAIRRISIKLLLRRTLVRHQSFQLSDIGHQKMQ